MTKLYSLLIAGTLLLAYSCKTTSKSYQKGDYEETIERGVKKLQKDPYDYETKDMVQNSYKYLVNQHEDRIRILSNSKNENRFESIYEEYVQLQRLYDVIHEYPAVAQVIKTTDYSEHVDTYREKSAEVHVEKAEKWIDRETKDGYREAYKEFNVALRYRPEDFDLKKRRDSIYEAALTKVVISPIQNYGGYQYGSQSQMQSFQKDVVRTLTYNMNNEFVKFYSENEAKARNIQPDQVLELNLNRISYGQPNDSKTSKEVTKEVVIKEIVYKPDSVVKQYGTVRANVTTTKRTLNSQGDLIVIVRDTKGQTIWNDRFTGEHNWQTEVVSYTGDERALTDSDKTLVNRTAETPPTENQILEALLKKIQDDLTYRLRSYYTKYQ